MSGKNATFATCGNHGQANAVMTMTAKFKA